MSKQIITELYIYRHDVSLNNKLNYTDNRHDIIR